LVQMNWQLLWFVLAGFVLGFAVSTLWEWVYYRGLRQQALAQLRQNPAPAYRLIGHESTPENRMTGAEAPEDASYRTPAVFIEGENGESGVQPRYEPLAGPWVQPSPPSPPSERREGTTS
jgi:hypothetical protein